MAALISAAITSFAVYSPSKVYADDNNYVAKYLDDQALAMIKQINSSANGVPVRAALKVSPKRIPSSVDWTNMLSYVARCEQAIAARRQWAHSAGAASRLQTVH